MGSARDVFNQYLIDKKIRHSEQRNLVLDVFLGIEKHLTVAELHEHVLKKFPKIGYVTVYRAMKVICEAGLAEEIDFGDGMTRYEHKHNHEHHDHLICLRCGNVVEAVNEQIEQLQNQMAESYGFAPIRHKLQIFGTCGKCKVKRKKRE